MTDGFVWTIQQKKEIIQIISVECQTLGQQNSDCYCLLCLIVNTHNCLLMLAECISLDYVGGANLFIKVLIKARQEAQGERQRCDAGYGS